MAKYGMSESNVGADRNKIKREPDKSKEPSREKLNNSVRIVSKTTSKVTTPISILIESLVNMLCSTYEADKKKVRLMYEAICDSLYKMHMIDESYKMNEFESMRTQSQQAFYLLMKTSRGGQPLLSIPSIWPHHDFTQSHYYREFEEVEFIAGGGFGEVFRVKHKLDGSEYAIKKISIRSEGLESVKNYLSEVKTFASLNHPNIVQYKAAWLDLTAANNNNIPTEGSYDSESDNLTSYSTKSHKIHEHISSNYKLHQDLIGTFSCKRNDSSEFSIDFEHSVTSIESHKNNSTSLTKCRNSRGKRKSVSEGDKTLCTLDFNELERIRMRQKSQEKWATLYIQMALCHSTLKQWLEKRNDPTVSEDKTKSLIPVNTVEGEVVREILKQLLKGIQYIHSKKIVHHDIKPSNIFIQIDNGKLSVQLGDFGLACPLQSVRHSLALGTRLYAAPEQLDGECNTKSDMYSLGIVLFELVETFTTDMEKVERLNELQKGHLPSYLLKQHPQLTQIILQLLSKSPQTRPDAVTLLATLTDQNGHYERQIRDLRCENQELKFRLAEKDYEISRLKDLLKSVGVKSI